MGIIVILLSVVIISLLYYINKDRLNSYFKRLHYKISKKAHKSTEKSRDAFTGEGILSGAVRVASAEERHRKIAQKLMFGNIKESNDSEDEIEAAKIKNSEMVRDYVFGESKDIEDDVEEAKKRILESTSDIHFGDSAIWSATMEFKFLKSYNGSPRTGHYLHQKMVSNTGEEKWEAIKFEE